MYLRPLVKPACRWLASAVMRSYLRGIHQHQQPDGAFVSQGGVWDPKADLAVLYSTVQAVVALRALGAQPRIDPVKVMDRFFVDRAPKRFVEKVGR